MCLAGAMSGNTHSATALATLRALHVTAFQSCVRVAGCCVSTRSVISATIAALASTGTHRMSRRARRRDLKRCRLGPRARQERNQFHRKH